MNYKIKKSSLKNNKKYTLIFKIKKSIRNNFYKFDYFDLNELFFLITQSSKKIKINMILIFV
jgi:hypothetical protein